MYSSLQNCFSWGKLEMLGVQPVGQGVISGTKKIAFIQVKFFLQGYNVVEFDCQMFFSKSDSWYKITCFTIAKLLTLLQYVELVFYGPIEFLYTETNPSKNVHKIAR